MKPTRMMSSTDMDLRERTRAHTTVLKGRCRHLRGHQFSIALVKQTLVLWTRTRTQTQTQIERYVSNHTQYERVSTKFIIKQEIIHIHEERTDDMIK